MKKTASPKAATKPSKPAAKAVGKAAVKAAAKPQPAETENLNLDEIKELIELIAEKQFTDFELERGVFRLRLGRGSTTKVVTETVAHNFAPETVPTPTVAPGVAASVPAPPEEALHIISSPIVGTFYRSSSPTTEPFVNIGDQITNGKTLCIVEAMKLMNEIQADTNGIVAKIFVENAQPVEYGQPLFGIKV
ncbi:MAG: acetyl-CoA carboxylase biotin carboxyl carrier protein [Acidobacteria bacterium]|nr:acetyl-CoA carboxylase biotin carboxyl carrier protein [Acidobacteriota bacterium]MBI3424358.1 acetyl-CoA carboxylase biotin carboxyl carrier protein [Acidobacteriota bacterium]